MIKKKRLALYRCGDPNHKNCLDLKNDVFGLNQTTQAYTTNVVLDPAEPPFCISSTIIADDNEIELIRKQLSSDKRKDQKRLADMVVF